MTFAVVLFAALAASIVNASPIPSLNTVPLATTIEAGLQPGYTPTGSPIHSKLSEVYDHCEDSGDDGPPCPPGSGFAKLPHPESSTVSGSNSVADYQQVMKGHGLDVAAEAESVAHYQQYRTSHGLDAAADAKSAAHYQEYRESHGLDAAAEAESAAHYQEYRTSHGLDAADSDRNEQAKSEEYENDGEIPLEVGHHPHIRHQKQQGSGCIVAGSGALCRVKQDAEPVQDHEASLVDPDIPRHIANIDQRRFDVSREQDVEKV